MLAKTVIRKRRPLVALVASGALVLAALLAWWVQNRGAAGTPQAATPASAPEKLPTVDVAGVEVMALVDDAQAVGSLRSRQGVMLRPEVSGRVAQLHFRDGERVRKGQLLLQLDDQLPQAQLQQSRAELSIATANHNRNNDLVAQNFTSQRSVQESAANVEVALARLALAQATAARLRILAPFDGIAGIRLVNVGDYLKDGADIVNIEDIDAMLVDFRLPERFQSKVRRGQAAQVTLDALPGQRFSAVIQAVDPLIDANGRSVGVRGCIDNRQLQLRPGMFARVSVVFGQRDSALVVPEEAIVPQGGKSWVIRLQRGASADAWVSQRVEVRLGIRRPGKVEIVQGLSAGDQVVTAGQQRISRDGTAVRVMTAAPAAASAQGPASAPLPSGALQLAGKVTRPMPSNRALAGANPCLGAKS